MPQVGERREMVGEDHCILFWRKVEDPAFAGRSLLWNRIEDRGPLRVFQVERVEHRVGDAW
jgi:hypothetical protein